MKIFRYVVLCFIALTGSGHVAGDPVEDTRLRVVTSFSILEDLVNQLGGEQVAVVNLVDRNSDAHIYQPRPSDGVAIANADLVVFNGLAFEGWIDRLIENSGFDNSLLIASDGVDVLYHGEEIDPHAWQSFHNIRVYVNNITTALSALRPQHAQEFEQRQISYLQSIDGLESRVRAELDAIPGNKRTVVTNHDAFGYLGRELDIRFVSPVGLSSEVEASARDVASVIDQIRAQDVTAIFIENITNPRLLGRISDETGVAIGGRLFSDALGAVDGPASTYLQMMTYNIESLINAFQAARK